MKNSSQIILALDFHDMASTLEMITLTREHIGVYKLGLEFYLAHGRDGVKKIQSQFNEIEIFLDLKLRDIPNTVAGACRSISDINPKFLTVHASGGSKMIHAASSALPNVEITAVTILTSLDQAQINAMGIQNNIGELTLSLAKNAVYAGAKAIVSSPQEVAFLRQNLGEKITLITPGVRPVGAEHDDQERVMTPKQAIEAGADFVVIGRPITKASDPKQVAREITASLR
ncbi:MAG: orotidine-5'-phosphate decarboxylase [Actinobacteria bacterium]|nr:orotidine-5'-phosphate decarboxylase [Actinomycetota bacterium]